MSASTSKGPVFDPGLCRCCGNLKKCRILNVEYKWCGQKEIYSEMFVDCFGLLLSNLDGEETKRLICATCVTRLRDASSFRQQVLQCEQHLLQTEIHLEGDKITSVDIKDEIRDETMNSMNYEHFENNYKEYISDDIALINLKKYQQHLSAEVKVNDAKKVTRVRRKRKAKRASGECEVENLEMNGEMLEKYEEMNERLRQRVVEEMNPELSKDEDFNGNPNSPKYSPFDNDYVNDDLGSVKSDPEYVPDKMEVKVKKKSTKERKKKRAQKASGEDMKKMENNGEILEKYVEIDDILRQRGVDTTTGKIKKLPKNVDSDYKNYQNTVTIVENTYVCPFDTSFSDYYCIYCREIYTDPEKLRTHTLTHDPLKFREILTNKKLPQIDITKVDCRICGASIDNIESVKTHLADVHEKTFHETDNEFLKFKLTLTNLSCLECGCNFRFFHALKKHMAEHFGTFICHVCGAHYFEERMFVLHQKSHKRIDENYPCKECGKVFKSKHSRYLHVARTHKKEPAYQCSKCDEILFSYSLRYRHMIEVHGEQRMYPCESCDRAYDSRKSLREHNRRFHLKIFKHQCDLCDKRFYLPSRLKEHLSTHTGERNFRCEYCGKSYPRLRGLKVHMQSHSTEKKYRCNLCMAGFTQNVNLKNHMKRTHHTDGDYQDVSQ